MIEPRELLAALGSKHRPTDQQAAIICADPNRPAVVIAGAGSGKTTTMTDRVLWLIANGIAEPHQILGLTFTRKAAASLDGQIQRGLAALRGSGEFAIPDGEPTVSTYHAYGARVMQEHALRLGIEPPSRTLRDAALWQLTERIVTRYEGDMQGLDLGLSAVVNAVNSLCEQMSEHEISATALIDFTESLLARLEALPGRRTKAHEAAITVQRHRLTLLPLVQRVLDARLASADLSFGDQMSWAARLATRVPEVGEWERSRYPFVLLDEYQDTSQSQLTLMRALFGGGHPVMAVGDPLQAIYEWRGASTGTIESFPSDFPASDGSPADRHLLTTSWRNDVEILTVSNHFAETLTAKGAMVHPLQARDAAGPGQVQMGLYRTVADEGDAIAAWLAPRWRDREPNSSFAVLVRSRSQIEAIERALVNRDLPVEVVGVAGLLATAEVIELRSMLQVLCEPESGPAIMRVLTGARWRLGAKDLADLHRFARRLSTTTEGEVDADLTVIEAIDHVDSAPQDLFTTTGRDRLSALARELRYLRRRIGLPLPDLILDLARVIGLDAEIAALAPEQSRRARAHVDAFVDQAAEFASLGGGVLAFLTWLGAAERHERGLRVEGIEPSVEAIQILTIHTAKGLEWDTVVVPGLRDQAFPHIGGGDENWLESIKVVPFPLRGDSVRLPQFSMPGSMADFTRSLAQFEADCDDRSLIEEERLAYVALTRARHALLLTSSWFGKGVTLRGPSSIFESARAVLPDAVMHDEPEPDDDRNAIEREQVRWPIDPLGARRPRLEAQAAAIANAPDQVVSEIGRDWMHEADVLLAERSRRNRGFRLPNRLSVSALVQLHADPAQLARRLRRPMPFRPDPLARRGTAFHRWLEERFASVALFDLDEFEGESASAELATLQERWLASEWAERTPHEIEVPFDHVLDSIVIRGRMDAVYRIGDQWVVVDWKTGPPKFGREAEAAAVQLAMYRLAWSAIAECPIGEVGAAFHHVADNVTIRPSDLLDEAGLIELIRSARQDPEPEDDGR